MMTTRTLADCPSTHAHVRQYVRRRMAMQCIVLRPLTHDDAVCANAAVENNVLDYNVNVRRG